MNRIRSFIVISIATITLYVGGASAQNYAASASGRTIEQQVFKQILGLPYYGLFDNMKFEVKGDTVILSGKVNSLGTRASAERVVKKIDGVRNVINNIDELPPSSFDNTIRRQLVRTFSRDGGSLYRYLQGTNPSIRLIVENGHVTLEGYVSNHGDYNLANILANGIPGVFNVQNNLVVESDKAR